MNFLQFNSPGYLFLLLLVPFLVFWYLYKLKKQIPTVQIAGIEHFQKSKRGLLKFWLYLLPSLKLLAFVAIVVALARPQTSTSRKNVNVEGIDIMLVTDVSSTMLAEDLKPNRIEAAKDVGIEFILNRKNDRIGLVVFGGEAFTQCPLTSNHSSLVNLYKNVKFGMIDDGTAIGDGLATAVNRLRESKAVSKVVILLTDGINNTGAIDPLSAAQIAKLYGIRVYTIGAGTIGTAMAPVNTPLGLQYKRIEVQIDEPLMTNVSELTGGKYFRATNKEGLRQIYNEIDKMEKSKTNVTEFNKKNEEYLIWVMAAIVLLIAEFIIRKFLLKVIN